MAKLIAGFVQNCKIILSMLKYEKKNAIGICIFYKGKVPRKRQPNYKIVPKANNVGGRLGQRRIDCLFKLNKRVDYQN